MHLHVYAHENVATDGLIVKLGMFSSKRLSCLICQSNIRFIIVGADAKYCTNMMKCKPGTKEVNL